MEYLETGNQCTGSTQKQEINQLELFRNSKLIDLKCKNISWETKGTTHGNEFKGKRTKILQLQRSMKGMKQECL